MGGDFSGNAVLPKEDKLWLAVEAVGALAERRHATPAMIESSVGGVSRCPLIRCCLLSGSFETHAWVQHGRK